MSRFIRGNTESLADDPLYAGQIKETHGRFHEVPNPVSVIGFTVNPLNEQLHVADVAGVAAQQPPGRRQPRA